MQASRHVGLARWSLVGLLLIAFAARVFTLTTQSLWRDEVDALRFATAPWSEMLRKFTLPGWNGPLYFALLRGWVWGTGQSEFAMRYFSLLWGVLAVSLAFVLARRLSERLAAFLCSLLFALSPYLVWYSQEVKMYTLVLALAALSIYALRRALDADGVWERAGWWTTLVVATSIAFYSHILAALLIPVEMILGLVWGVGLRRRGWWRGALAALSCLTLPYLPLMIWQAPLALEPAQTGYTFYSLDQMLLVMLNGFSSGFGGVLIEAWLNGLSDGLGGTLTLAAVDLAGVLLMVGAVAGAARWRDKAMLAVWLLLPPLIVFLISLNRPIFTDRYLIWIGPAFYLLVAMGAVAAWRLWRPLGVVAIIAVAGIAVAGTYGQAATPIKSDLRGAARYFQAHRSSGDLVIFQIPYVRYTFDYYQPQPYDWAEGLFTNYGMSDAEVDVRMRTMVADRKTVWLVASEMEMWDGQLQVWKWLESHGRRTDSAEFAQVMMYRYEF